MVFFFSGITCLSKFSADMAQLVERTLGKGEVPSSILGISTTSLNHHLGGFFVSRPCKTHSRSSPPSHSSPIPMQSSCIHTLRALCAYRACVAFSYACVASSAHALAPYGTPKMLNVLLYAPYGQ